MNAAISLVLLLAASGVSAGEDATKRWSPANKGFACEIPRAWQAFDEEEPQGSVAHILGPDNPAGTYRTGIDVHWVERGQPGFVEWKDAVERMRRADKETSREASPVRLFRTGGTLARVFEVTENRRLPPDRLPSSEQALHHYVAVVPSGSSYYIVRLSSTRDVYLDYKDEWARFLKTFRP